jgi:hypothetical protein
MWLCTLGFFIVKSTISPTILWFPVLGTVFFLILTTDRDYVEIAKPESTLDV